MAEGALKPGWRSFARGGWLHSPTLAPWQAKAIARMKARLRRVSPPGTFWILSSGTQTADQVKAIALPAEAFLASAEAVNRHLESTASDVWMVALPLFHVGGLGILARAHLSGAGLAHQPRWNARAFASELGSRGVTLTSLVPTQVHDLVISGLKAPASLRAVVVGGGALDPELYHQGRRLGWPLLPSYGLTECASQVATASLASLDQPEFPTLRLLDHVEARVRRERLQFRTPAGCRWIARGSADGAFSLEDPWRAGWLPTEDMGELNGRGLRPMGRGDDVVKVLGELVSLTQVEHQAKRFFAGKGLHGDLTVLALAGGREGHRLMLVTDSARSLASWDEALSELNASLSGPERLAALCWIEKIPRGDLGKVKKAALRSALGL